jgi:uncharacterized iron-regulated membrane protein
MQSEHEAVNTPSALPVRDGAARARRERADRVSAIYRSVWLWHFWSGLVITPVLIVVSVTGALYVFKAEIEAWMKPEVYTVQPAGERVGFEAFREAFDSRHPDFELRFVNVPDDAERAWEGIALRRPGQGDPLTMMAYFDPWRGELTGVHPRNEGFFAVVLALHRNLMGGLPGRILVEAATCWCIVSVLAGLYLWWPRKKEKFWGVWLPRFSGSLTRLLRDWHTVPGMYLSIVTLFVLLSGLLFTQIWGLAYQGINLATGGLPSFLLDPPKSERPAGAAQAIDADRALALAREQFDFTQAAYSVDLPSRGGDGAYQFISDTETALIDHAVMFIDQYSGRTLLFQTEADMPWRTRFTQLFYPVHVGSIFGRTTQVLAVLSCVLLVAMALTGVWMWLRRRKPGSFGAPPSPPAGSAPRWLVRLTIGLAVFLPTVGISLLLIHFGDRLWQRRRPARISR